MAYSAGVFTPTALQKARAKASEMWASDVWNKQWKRPTGVFNFLTNRQAVRVRNTGVQTLINGRYCNQHEVWFLNDVNDTSSETYSGDSADCTFTGAELGSDAKTYTSSDLGIFRRTVNSVKCVREDDFDLLRATAMMNIKMDLELELEKDLLTFITANTKGTLTGFSPTTGTWDETNDKWVITPAQATAEFIAEIKREAIKFRMIDPVLVCGNAYFLERMKADAEPGSGYQNYNALLTDPNLPIVHNIVDLDTISGGTKMYLVDAASIGFIPSQENQNTSPLSNVADLFFWYEGSMNLTYSDGGQILPVPFDWRMRKACTGASSSAFAEHYEGKAAGVFAEAPQPEQTIYPNIVEISIEA